MKFLHRAVNFRSIRHAYVLPFSQGYTHSLRDRIHYQGVSGKGSDCEPEVSLRNFLLDDPDRMPSPLTQSRNSWFQPASDNSWANSPARLMYDPALPFNAGSQPYASGLVLTIHLKNPYDSVDLTKQTDFYPFSTVPLIQRTLNFGSFGGLLSHDPALDWTVTGASSTDHTLAGPES